MNFTQQTPLNIVLNTLFESYRKSVPAVDTITKALITKNVISSPNEIINDHIAFRTLGVPHLGIASFERIFLHYGYTKKDYYYFESKNLNAYWYAPPSPEYPRIFMSELVVTELSENVQQIIAHYTKDIVHDPVDDLDLDNGKAVADFLQKPLWQLPSLADYKALLRESEYAAWVIYNRYYLNHYTISVHSLMAGYSTLQEFNNFVESLGIKLNDAGGKIKVSKDGLLAQSSTVASLHNATFANSDQMSIAGSYVEFAERKILPEFSNLPANKIETTHRRDGFETNNADKIFESTYTSQIKNK
ncbi:DUF1338 domain-containing protein [Pedobacter arcticus]|uniref:DUF1338 domain-containing protein n=1 Tax=Pedobacter arcticus TaxID=752140 RepID=UPI0002F8F1BA|nr:DUF1338 domain-containing protein [Pedobacter arcticus]